jgi:hypothetical protein
LVIQVAAAATKAEATTATKSPGPVASKNQPAETLEQKLERARNAARKYRGTIRFYETHRSLLSTSRENRGEAVADVREATRGLAQARRSISVLELKIERRNARRRAAMTPKAAICDVFGSYCAQAVDVAWCESRLRTTAQNGQYLGLFQMGYSERRLFGHGETAHEQAVAAHKYFVRSGRDWSPWSCRWAAS